MVSGLEAEELRFQLNQVFGGQSLMITYANRFAFVILRLVRLHSELAGGHGNPGARPVHKVINALRVVQVCTIGVAFRIYNKRPTLITDFSLDDVFTYSSKVWIQRSIGKLVN